MENMENAVELMRDGLCLVESRDEKVLITRPFGRRLLRCFITTIKSILTNRTFYIVSRWLQLPRT